MRRTTAAAGSTLFFAIAPGVVTGLVPWWLTHWQVRGPLAPERQCAWDAQTSVRQWPIDVGRLR